MKVFMTIEKLSFTAIAAACGARLVEAKKHDDKASSLREDVNKDIIVLHKAKVVIGRYSKEGNGCANAMAFVDSLVVGGWAKKTAQNYLSLFKDAVKTGKPVLDWGGTKGGKTRKGAKTAKATTAKELADKLATAYRDADFEGFVNDLQASYENDEVKTLLEGIQSYLEAAGIELK
jgi:hypothetical protein